MLDGEWAWRVGRPAGAGEYSFRLRGKVGVCTRTNAPAVFTVGQVIFELTGWHGPLIFARQLFTDGVWHNLVAAAAGDSLYLSGGGWQWILTRTTAAQPISQGTRWPRR
ncbi:hypothetical protein BJY16_006609 [Actinoplanes octamycinicus]|uniref:Uncharacterized protein n=1 Tax=Actinoplanes octamycinicus TaxID=135948 RepID=A0A7W7H371_9ACTN|nr:hypothetical protein [Actinoplanes octamycinicus]MBB4743150.1 hypothetical protein [Actinoplanes octamycinicus]GIE61288.1 hypothetical protein Aoc01nite_66900 [Actinoplanes octamycinicus]